MKKPILILIFLILAGCAPRATILSRISLDLTKAEVIQKLGEPQSVRGALKNENGQVLEVWEYRLHRYAGAIEGLSPYYDLYWLYFINDKLVRWGKAGDWEQFDKKIDIRVR
jgi:hypothetical protein